MLYLISESIPKAKIFRRNLGKKEIFMEEKMNTAEEFSLTDILSALVSKIKLLILVFLTGCFIGGALGFAKSYDVVYYGTNLTFFVSPEAKNEEDGESFQGVYGYAIMDTMVRYLRTEKATEVFVEDMKLEGVDLPQKPDPELYKTDADAYFRQVTAYDSYIRKVKNSLSFYYKEDASDEVKTSSTESNNYIYVSLAVKEEGIFNKAFTGELLRQLQVKIPKVIKSRMVNPDESKYNGTNCELVTPLYPMVEWMNQTYALKETIKYAVVIGAGTLFLACIAVIVIDRLDKRIKDVSVIQKKFGLPVLGIIPSNRMEVEDDKSEKGGK